MNEELSFLQNVPIFADLEEPELRKIAKLGVRKKYKKGNIVVLEQEMGAALFVIVSGKVKIVRTDEDGREVILSIFGPGEFFGEMSLLDGLARSASVVWSLILTPIRESVISLSPVAIALRTG